MKRFAMLLVFLLPALLLGQTHSATLTWADLLNPAGTNYNVYRATGLCSGAPVFSKLSSAIAVKTYADATVTPGNYCYQVTGSVAGMESAPSNSAAAAVPSFAPTGLAVIVAGLFEPILLQPIVLQLDVSVPSEASE